MARRRARDPEPSLFPFLSVLAAVMGTLTLIIAGMSKIALANPKQRVEIERFDPGKKGPVHVECRADGLLIHPDPPGDEPPIAVPRGAIEEADGPWASLRSRLELDPTRYLMLLVRAEGIGTFHEVRTSVSGTSIEIGYQPLFGTGDVRFEPREAGR